MSKKMKIILIVGIIVRSNWRMENRQEIGNLLS